MFNCKNCDEVHESFVKGVRGNYRCAKFDTPLVEMNQQYPIPDPRCLKADEITIMALNRLTVNA